MNDCIHASHCRLDRRLISDIANQNFYTSREHARCRSIEREGTDPETCLIQSMNDARTNRAGGPCNENNFFYIWQIYAIFLIWKQEFLLTCDTDWSQSPERSDEPRVLAPTCPFSAIPAGSGKPA